MSPAPRKSLVAIHHLPRRAGGDETSPVPVEFDRHGCQRVAVVDFDVHHGNGTQRCFEGRSEAGFDAHERDRTSQQTRGELGQRLSA